MRHSSCFKKNTDSGWLILLSIALAASPINAGEAKGNAFDKLVDRAMASGREIPSTGEVGQKAGLGQLHLKVIFIRSDETSDGLTHEFAVGTDSGTPKCLLLSSHLRTPQSMESDLFRTSLSGRLELALHQAGKYDDNGKPVTGSAEYRPLDSHARDVKKRFQHELDFWLKSKYHKSPNNKSVAPK